jgi:radical SAM superfamily enzyme YgiQ (UPF0313 family)
MPESLDTPHRPRVLLTSVFGPYARDDEYGSRTINPMELHHNQVTRVQGPFSLRMFHRSWGLMMIQSNLEAPTTLLDFPTLERFVEEIRDHRYDVVGISAIVVNVLKVRKMCELIRRHLPRATIVVGGHVCSLSDIDRRVDADHYVRGEGIRWFRTFLGEDPEGSVRHPELVSAMGLRVLGRPVHERPEDRSATIVPSVGCPLGCNFCCTSALFGGKGKSVVFYRTGDELFDLMSQLEASMSVRSFFIMDENFLLYRKRALRLLQLMEEHDKDWSLSVFSSASALRGYSTDELVRLGVSFVWVGLEGEDSRYDKLRGTDTRALVREMQSNGIRVLGSTIIGLENHTPENIDQVIAHAVDHDTDFHQFMLYMAMPGTPLAEEVMAEGRLKDEADCPLPEIHGQSRLNSRHPHLADGRESEYLLRAFREDFRVNGPTLTRIFRTMLLGWRRHRDHPDARVRRRVARESASLGRSYAAALGAIRSHYRRDPALRAKLDAIHAELVGEFGWRARLNSWVGGWVLRRTLRREEKRLARGWTYEPPTFYEKNAAARASTSGDGASATPCRQVALRVAVTSVAEEAVGEPIGVSEVVTLGRHLRSPAGASTVRASRR